ncbi:MAG TPA: beta-galactosidase [Chthoniobacterales bacterium]|nr:beta-galactosidase [Chthoniobacterales bacterium]
MTKTYSYNSFLYGVVYYPEQWPEERWESDLARIAETGMNVVRMGEGAWSIWEPEEGRYDFAMFDRALALCQKHGLKAIMGTPTYTPPAWLTERYPEVLRCGFDGTRLTHGSRRHYNYTSPVYRTKSEAITEALARHYRDHPVVIGWQIDNELNCHLDTSFAESDHQAFRTWCRERYQTLDALNQAWGTAFWSQTYTDWDQVWLPRPTVTYQNPNLLLDFYRFTSDITIRFGAKQYQIIKSIAPHQFVTHNAFQSMTNVDLPAFVRDVADFVSYDSYPEFKVCDLNLSAEFRDRSESRLLSRMRGVSTKFMVLEQQSGPSGQIGGILNGNPDYLHPTPKPGQMRLWCWNSIANGADGLLFFRWRSLPYGSEAHWNGLLYHDERNTWRLEEAKRLGEEIKRVAATLTNSRCVSQAAILYDYDNESHARIERATGKYRDSNELAVYQALSERHFSVDVRGVSTIQTGADLAGYKVVFFPHAHILTAADVKPLLEYAEAGGTLVFGCWSAYRDRKHWCYSADDKGFYENLVGVRVADFTTITPGEASTLRFTHGGALVPAPVFNEVLTAGDDDVSVLAAYTSDYYAGQPGVTAHRLGRGRIVHFGAFFTPENAAVLLDALEVQDPLAAKAEIPAAVQATLRSDDQEEFCCLLNFTKTNQPVVFKQPVFDLLEEQKLNGRIEIPPYGVRFVRW